MQNVQKPVVTTWSSPVFVRVSVRGLLFVNVDRTIYTDVIDIS